MSSDLSSYHYSWIPEVDSIQLIDLLVHICTLPSSSWHILRNQQVLNLQLKGYVTLRHWGRPNRIIGASAQENQLPEWCNISAFVFDPMNSLGTLCFCWLKIKPAVDWPLLSYPHPEKPSRQKKSFQFGKILMISSTLMYLSLCWYDADQYRESKIDTKVI